VASTKSKPPTRARFKLFKSHLFRQAFSSCLNFLTVRYNEVLLYKYTRIADHNVFARSDIWIVGSNTTEGMDVCQCLIYVRVGSGVATG
jgi:hypothetical protein